MEKAFSVKKLIVVIFLILAAAGIIVYLFFPQLYIKFVSGNAADLERGVVTVYNEQSGSDPYVIEIKDGAALKKLYSVIENTSDIRTHRYPRHSVLISVNPKYEIQLFYAGGKTDRFGTSENPQSVYRALENNKDGYIIGQNSELAEYVSDLAKDK